MAAAVIPAAAPQRHACHPRFAGRPAAAPAPPTGPVCGRKGRQARGFLPVRVHRARRRPKPAAS
jgi:hypothetical protein